MARVTSGATPELWLRILGRAPHAIGQGDLSNVHLPVRRFAEHQPIGPRLDVPIIVGGLIDGEQARIDRQLNLPRLAWLQASLCESTEPFGCFPAGRLPIGGRDVDLGHALALPLAGIADSEAHL